MGVYQPAMRGDFLWDDDDYVTRNHLLTDVDGWRKIWFSTEHPSQYFPMTYSVFRVQHRFWGLNPLGYHLVNTLLHATNAVLLYRVLLTMEVPGAMLAAALFALHPIQVESVAWITELKNVLSLFFSLLSLLAWLAWRRHKGQRSSFFVLALLFFLCAAFSKTTAVVLPVIFLIIAWYQRDRIDRRYLGYFLPLLAIGFGLGMLTIWWERNIAGTRGAEFSFSLAERLLIAGRALWFHLGKLVWPAHLSFSYPRWEIDAGAALQYLWPLTAIAAIAAAWRFREWGGRGPAAAMAVYLAALAPLLGFIPLYTFKYSYVADHYQYMASIGPLSLAAAFFRPRNGSPGPIRRLLLPLLLVSLYGALSWQQSQAYRNPETLWQDTLAKNPLSWMARNNLGSHLVERGRTEEALVQLRESLKLNPGHVKTLNLLGFALAKKGEREQAESYYRAALRSQPTFEPALTNLGILLVETGRTIEAELPFREALRLAPGSPITLNNLGIVMHLRGRRAEAVALFQAALSRDPEYPEALVSMGNVYDQTGTVTEARRQYARAARHRPPSHVSKTNLTQPKNLGTDSDRATTEYGYALQIDPGLEEARAGLRRVQALRHR